MPLTMADMPDEVKALVSGDLTAGKNDTVSIGNYITFDTVHTTPTITLNNDASLIVSGDLESQSAVTLDSLPTTDPHNAGDLWNNGGTVKVSAG